MADPICKECRYFEPIEDREGFGLCRCEAPAPDMSAVPLTSKRVGEWPVADGSRTPCGLFAKLGL